MWYSNSSHNLGYPFWKVKCSTKPYHRIHFQFNRQEIGANCPSIHWSEQLSITTGIGMEILLYSPEHQVKSVSSTASPLRPGYSRFFWTAIDPLKCMEYSAISRRALEEVMTDSSSTLSKGKSVSWYLRLTSQNSSVSQHLIRIHLLTLHYKLNWVCN